MKYVKQFIKFTLSAIIWDVRPKKERSNFMKATGIVRAIDDLGRVVIPMELRKTLHLNKRDMVEIFTEDTAVILKKWEASCVFCGEKKNTIQFKEHNICRACLKNLKEKT